MNNSSLDKQSAKYIFTKFVKVHRLRLTTDTVAMATFAICFFGCQRSEISKSANNKMEETAGMHPADETLESYGNHLLNTL